MGYKKGPVGHMKASTGNKAVGYMAEGSTAYMSALHQVDPKDGVVVTGKDKSKSAEQARAERLAKSKQEREDALMRRKIAKENKREEFKFKLEEKKAAIAAKRQRAEQAMKKRRGQIPSDAQDTSTNYMRGPLNQNDPKDGNKTQMKDLPIGSKARYDEYNKRGWMHDETSLTQKGSRRQTDLRKSSNFKNLMDRNRVPIDEKEYNKRKKKGANVTDLFEQHSRFAKGEKINLPEGTGYSRVNQRINDFRK